MRVLFVSVVARVLLRSLAAPMTCNAGGGDASSSAEGLAIVTTEVVVESSLALEAYLCHKSARGYRVHLFTESAWGATQLAGDAAADALRQFLSTAVSEHNLQFLLLIGDPRPHVGPLPMKTLWPRTTGAIDSTSGTVCTFTQEAVPSDYYYSVLEGDWDLNGNGLFGEFGRADATAGATGDFGIDGVGSSWALAVGRIPVYVSDNAGIAKLDHILEKTMAYEAESQEGISWRLNSLVAAEGEIRMWWGEAMAQLYATQPGHLGTFRVYDAADCWPPDPSDRCGQTNIAPGVLLTSEPEALQCSVANVGSGWLQRQPGVVSWLTHGGGHGAANVMNLATAMSLNDTRPAITFQASCLNAKPSVTTNIAYSLLVNGAVGTVASTVVSHGPGQLTTGQTFPSTQFLASIAGMAHEFVAKVQSGEPVGTALADVKESTLFGRCWYWQNFAGFVLYGDPSIKLYANVSGRVSQEQQVPPECHGPVCQATTTTTTTSLLTTPSAHITTTTTTALTSVIATTTSPSTSISATSGSDCVDTCMNLGTCAEGACANAYLSGICVRPHYQALCPLTCGVCSPGLSSTTTAAAATSFTTATTTSTATTSSTTSITATSTTSTSITMTITCEDTCIVQGTCAEDACANAYFYGTCGQPHYQDLCPQTCGVCSPWQGPSSTATPPSTMVQSSAMTTTTTSSKTSSTYTSTRTSTSISVTTTSTTVTTSTTSTSTTLTTTSILTTPTITSSSTPMCVDTCVFQGTCAEDACTNAHFYGNCGSAHYQSLCPRTCGVCSPDVGQTPTTTTSSVKRCVRILKSVAQKAGARNCSVP